MKPDFDITEDEANDIATEIYKVFKKKGIVVFANKLKAKKSYVIETIADAMVSEIE